jgi:hypothetical protein
MLEKPLVSIVRVSEIEVDWPSLFLDRTACPPLEVAVRIDPSPAVVVTCHPSTLEKLSE